MFKIIKYVKSHKLIIGICKNMQKKKNVYISIVFIMKQICCESDFEYVAIYEIC